MRRHTLVFLLFATATAAARAAEPPSAPLPAVPDDWVSFVRTNAAAASEADFRDGALMPLLREEALAPLLAGPDRDAPWLAEAANYVERELLLAWEGPGWLTSPENPKWGLAYDFTIRAGSKDPFLTWMSVVGQKKWHWDDKARVQLAELEAALAARPADEAPFARLLAAHARQFVDPSPRHRVALCAAAVRWAESNAARPDRSEAVLRVLEQFVDVDEPAFVAALLDSAADPWIGLVAAGNAAFERHRDTCDSAERERNVADAEAAWRRARELHPEFPQGAEGMMRVAAHRKDRAGIAAWFRAGVAARYDSPSLHDRYAAFLRPACGGSIEALRRHAADCFAAADARPRSMLPYGGVLALLAALDVSGEQPAAFFGPGDAAELSSALLPMLGGDPSTGPSGATDRVRFESAWFLASVHWVLGDEEGAFRAYETVRGVPNYYCRRLQSSFRGSFDVFSHLAGLTGPDADLVRSLRRRLLDGDAEGFLGSLEAFFAENREPDYRETALLERLAVRAFLAARFPRGETRRVPLTPHGAFACWHGYGIGWQPEVDDAGGYAWYTGRQDLGILRFGIPLPLPLEIETAFEPDPATNVLFAVRVLPADLLLTGNSGPTPALSVRLEGDTLRLRLGPAGDRYLDWGVDKKTPVFETNAPLLSLVARRSSLVTRHSAERIPLRVVFLPDRVRCYLGDAETPALDAPTAAFDPASFPDGARLVFYGADCRFFGFSFRNPAASRGGRDAENLEPGTFEPGTSEQPNANEDSDMKLSSLAPAAATAVLAAAPAAAPAQETADPATPAVAAAQETEPTTSGESDSRHSSLFTLHFEDADYVLSGPDDPREFLREWQEALLPLANAVTQEVGVVGLSPVGGAEALEAWFAPLVFPVGEHEKWSLAPFPALLAEDPVMGDTVFTNLARATAAVLEADPDYDPAWLIDETLPGIPEEHRRALLPFYDPSLVTLSFDAVPDAALFVGESDSTTRHSSPVTRHSSLTPHSSTNAASGGFERARSALGTAANGGLGTPAEPASNGKSGVAEATPPPQPDFKLLQRLLYQELVVPYYAGPDGSTYFKDHGAAVVWKFALELGRGRFMLVPNREWGGAYDLVVRYGVDDPFVRFCASVGCWKWGWTDKARELRDDLAFRLAGGDASPFQSLLLAHLDQRYEPSPERLAALRDAFDAWAATLAGEFDRDDVRAWLGHWLVEDVAAGVEPARGINVVRDAREAALARRGADPAPDADPAPGTVPVHDDFVRDTFLPLLLREVVAPLEAIERDRAAPWRPMALAALRDWCHWISLGEDWPDPLYLGRAVSAAGRGCPWPAVRFLAALKNYDDAAWPQPAFYGRATPAEIDAAARRVADVLLAAADDPATTSLARLLMCRAAFLRTNLDHPIRPGGASIGDAFADAFAAAAAIPPQDPAEARVLWALRPPSVDWENVRLAAADDWLREMAAGRAAEAKGNVPAALPRFDRAAELRPAFPEPWIERLRLHSDEGRGARVFYDEARARELDAPGAAGAMIDALRPVHGGSVEDILAFGDECFASGRFDTRLPVAWAKSRYVAASLLGPDWEEPFRGADAITNMDRVADSLLASPHESRQEACEAFHMRIWPLYANNDFPALHRACGTYGSCEGDRNVLEADFDDDHPMKRYQTGLAYGFAGYHHEDVEEAMRLWRVEGDLPAARAAFLARAGRVSAATNTVDNWEQSFIAGRLAVLDCTLARPGDPPYSLLPRIWSTPHYPKFWRSLRENFGFNFEQGILYAGRYVAQMAASEPVVPSNAVLAVSVRPWPDWAFSRFWIVPDDTPAFRPGSGRVRGLLLERCPHGWNAGWADLDLFGGGDAPERGTAADRIHLPSDAIDPDGAVRVELQFLDGAVTVLAAGKPVPALAGDRPVSATQPHAVAFVGNSFEFLQADVRVLPPPTPSPADEPHAEFAEFESHAETTETAEPEPHAESAESAE